MLWRPRSILQLTLIGFVTVVAPLCGAIFFSIQAFNELALQSNRTTQQLVVLTRANQVLQSGLLDLERRAGQYVALGEENLRTLFVQEHSVVLEQLDQLETMVDKERSFRLLPLRESLLRVRGAMLAPPELFDSDATLPLFAEISDQGFEFRRASQQYVDEQLGQQVEEASGIKQKLIFMVASLTVLTLVTILFFIYWINRPVRQLEREINQLGTGDLSRPISIAGPLEMQQLGQRLDWLRSRLSELDEQKQQFLRHMSHELKTPLASLREGADLMADGVVGDLDSRQGEIITIIQQNSRELQRLIENLLDYNQVLHHHQLNLQSLEIVPLWDELLSSYAITIKRKALRIRKQGAPTRWTADVSKLRTILDNLLSNAANYCPERGCVGIRWGVKDKVLHCEVGNTGKAIPENEREQIFKAFFQGKHSRSGPIKGSGIGLSVALECARAHGGTLKLVKDAEFPVCFSLELPLLEVES